MMRYDEKLGCWLQSECQPRVEGSCARCIAENLPQRRAMKRSKVQQRLRSALSKPRAQCGGAVNAEAE